VYDGNCAGCHRLGSYDTAGNPELAGKGSLVSGKIGSGHMGLSLTAEALNALVNWIDQNSTVPAPSPNPGPAPAPVPAPAPQCGSCHGLPPADSAHAAHRALPGVGTNCAVCHTSSSAVTHNDGWVDLAIAATYNAKSGAAAENPNGTPSCVTVSCHGGQTTPDWGNGTINVNTQCTSCHARGTTQYNSYNSGQHGRSDHTRQACTACHNTTTLAANHFSRLDTPTMEGPASATVGGGSTRVNSYNASTKTCTTSCHGSERW
jgi:predicted CxxxxCH...CXXCH cytochrome family protein